MFLVGNPKNLTPSFKFLLPELIPNVSAHYYWLEKSSIFIKWMKFYNSCLLCGEIGKISSIPIKKLEDFTSSDNIIKGYLDSVSELNSENIGLKYHYGQVDLIDYLKTETSEKLIFRLGILLKTLIEFEVKKDEILEEISIEVTVSVSESKKAEKLTSRTAGGNFTNKLIAILSDIIQYREAKLQEKIESDNHRIMQNLPKLFMLLGGKNENENQSQQKNEVLEAALLADPVISKLKKFYKMLENEETKNRESLQKVDQKLEAMKGGEDPLQENLEENDQQLPEDRVATFVVETTDQKLAERQANYEMDRNKILKLFESSF